MTALSTATGSLRRLIRTAVIKDFELAYELCWKAGQELAKTQNMEVGTPREAFSYLQEKGMIEDTSLAYKILESRNRTTHTYRDQVAERIAKEAAELFLPFFRTLERALQG